MKLLPRSPSPHTVTEQHIGAVRRFNRFHTRLVGALSPRLLASAYPLPQARVLYEIAQGPTTAARLARELAVDAGYLSRLLASLERDALIAREPSPEHAKRLNLRLTPAGHALFEQLNARSSAEVAGLLQRLPAHEQALLVGAMATVQRLLGGLPSAEPGNEPGDEPRAQPAAPAFTLREPRPGDLGAIVRGHALLYTQEYGWDWTFEAFVAEIVARFVRHFEPGAERCWVAEREGQVVGSAFVVRDDAETAKLRMLYVDASARGLGLGRELLDECLAFARAAGYGRMRLWTNDVLTAARRLYQSAGFELVEESPHHSFGQDLVGQVWAKTL